MIDKNKEYTTRDGRKVRIYATDGFGEYPIHGSVGGVMSNWTREGEYTTDNGLGHWDLIEPRKPIKMKKYVSVWHNERKDGYTIGSIYESREQLSATLLGCDTKKLAAFIPVTIEGFEGDGL